MFRDETCNTVALIIVYPIYAIVAYVISFVVVYVAIPFADICLGCMDIFTHGKYEGDTQCYECDEDNDQTSDFIPAKFHNFVKIMKFPEQLGEAIPQLIIAVIFFSKNAHWLSSWEMFEGGFTMALSCGSIIFGVYTGIKRVLK